MIPAGANASRAVGLALAAFLAPPAAAGSEPLATEPRVPPPIPWQDPAPVARLFLQLPFEAPETAPPGTLRGDLRLLYSNSLLVGRSASYQVDIHVETACSAALLAYGVGRAVELQLAVPFIVDTGGFLDAPIYEIEGVFHANNPQRRGRPRDVLVYQLTRTDDAGIRSRSNAALGDVWAGLKAQVRAQDRGWPALGLRAAVKAPTGRLPFGSEETDLGGSFLAAWRGGRWALRLEGDALFPTGTLRAAGIRTRPYAAWDAGMTWAATPAIALHAQLSGDLSPLASTGVSQLDAPVNYVLAGGTFALGRIAMEAAIVENVLSPYRGADVAFELGIRTVDGERALAPPPALGPPPEPPR